MKHIKLFVVLMIVLGGMLTACATESSKAEKVNPVQLEAIEGSELKRVILTEKAAQRIDVQTAPAEGKTIPYAAVIYDTEGNTWVYTNPEPLTFLRQAVVVDHIAGDEAFLTEPLEKGTNVVTLGVAEIYGAETGVSK